MALKEYEIHLERILHHKSRLFYCTSKVFLIATIFFFLLFFRLTTYIKLLEENSIKIPAWFSFSAKDGIHVVSGDSLDESATITDAC